MSDRLVRQIDPRPNDETEAAKPFSTFAPAANIILVGDPGAGKSHLFCEQAAKEGVPVFTARSFLVTPIKAMHVLFIDALDERRAGRDDRDTIDLIVQRLFQMKPSKVRIACREHDWLGGTDLASFRPYFSQAGGVTVLSLQALSEFEQVDLLLKRGVLDPPQFIKEANRRGLSDLLLNPQNLIMLSDAVLDGSWPTTRRELLEVATNILLKEHNEERVRRGGGRYGVEEVRGPASSACALRLISDVDGISLSEADNDPRVPSYRTIPFYAPELMLAALGRRAFRSIGDEAVDYLHRVSAEYAAAKWLAEQVRDGLPLARVMALIGVDGNPAPELRGVHAWLSVLLPEHANELIDSDPFGVLVYGDASAFARGELVALLSALGRLAEDDPFFRPENSAPVALRFLVRPDMGVDLATVLTDPSKPFGLKFLILDALAAFGPVPETEAALLSLLSDTTVPYGLKSRALAAALRIGDSTKVELAAIYRSLGDSSNDLRLRAEMMTFLYGVHFGAQDVIELLDAATSTKAEEIVGTLWELAKAIPLNQVPFLLDALCSHQAGAPVEANSRDRTEPELFVQRLILRALGEDVEHVSGRRLWKWLQLRSSYRDRYSSESGLEIQELLTKHPRLAPEMLEAALDGYDPRVPSWYFSSRLRRFMPFSLGGKPLEWLISRIVTEVDESKKEAFYALAWSWLDPAADDAESMFSRLYAIGDEDLMLQRIRNNNLTFPIDQWRVQDNERIARERDKKRLGRRRNVEQFTQQLAEIRAGAHRGWMAWGASVYFSNFIDLDEAKTPRERLEEQLGAENAAIILEGFKAFLKKGDLPTVEEISQADASNSYPSLWLAFMAGMEEAWLERPTFSGLTDQTLKSLAALDLVLPSRGGDRDGARRWKPHLLKTRLDLVRDVYLQFVRLGMARGREHVPGLYELLNNDVFVSDRGQITIALLEAFPNAPARLLEEIMQIALTQSPRPLLEKLASQKFALMHQLGDEQRIIWVTASYLLKPEIYQRQFLDEAGSNHSIVWKMRALSRFDRRNNSSPSFQMTPTQLKLMVQVVARHYEDTGYPSGAWWGDENPWDAADFVRSLLDTLSADASEGAARMLHELAIDPQLESYRNHVKHALANQRRRLSEMAYIRPNWNRTIATLSNKAPANISDLQALVLDHLRDIGKRIGAQNNDLYKQFWNEDSHGRPTSPKSEESARDVLLELLKPRLNPLGISVEPEAHMVVDKRADIVAMTSDLKLVIELKRDNHPNLWKAPSTQLDRFYTRDPGAGGLGIFGVFGYGNVRAESASEMEDRLRAALSPDQQKRLRVVVIDVSVPDGGTRAPSPESKSGKRGKAGKGK